MGIQYSPQIVDEIINRLSEGEPLRAICRDSHMPSFQAVYQWLDKDEDFARRFTQARLVGADAIADEIVSIIDDGTNDWMEKLTADGQPTGLYVLNGEHVQRSKLRAEMRLKLLAKWFPSKYGDKSSMELTGANGGPVQITETQRVARLKAILAAAQQRKDGADKDDVSDLA